MTWSMTTSYDVDVDGGPSAADDRDRHGHGDKHSIVTGRRRVKRAQPCVVECAFHQRVSSNGFSTVELQSNGI